MSLSLGENLSALLGELGGFFAHAFLECLLVAEALFGRVFTDVIRYFH